MEVQKKSKKRWLLWISLGILALIIIGVASEDKKADAAPANVPPDNTTNNTEELPIKVTAIKLYNDYEANEVAADNMYKGKRLEVTGTVESINKDIADDVYISLTAGEILSNIQCHLSDPGKAAELKKGQRITVTGTGDMMIIGIPQLRDCELK